MKHYLLSSIGQPPVRCRSRWSTMCISTRQTASMYTNTATTNGDTGRTLPPDAVLFGRSEAMTAVRHRVTKTCQTSIPVLLCGDAGTVKETIARWIHSHSSNADGEFVKVNCAAIPNSLLASELFGYEKDAFTGANTTKPGRVELADT